MNEFAITTAVREANEEGTFVISFVGISVVLAVVGFVIWALWYTISSSRKDARREAEEQARRERERAEEEQAKAEEYEKALWTVKVSRYAADGPTAWNSEVRYPVPEAEGLLATKNEFGYTEAEALENALRWAKEERERQETASAPWQKINFEPPEPSAEAILEAEQTAETGHQESPELPPHATPYEHHRGAFQYEGPKDA